MITLVDITYLCPYEANLSKRDASVEIIVVIFPAGWADRERPEMRNDLRKMIPMSWEW